MRKRTPKSPLNPSLTVGVVIAAGGSGKRVGGRIPKQFRRVGGATILEHSLRRFTVVREIKEIIVVVPERDLKRTRRILAPVRSRAVLGVVAGGKERQDSVWCGLMAFSHPPDIVLVHDAVRPFVHARTVRQVIHDAVRCGGAVVGVRVKDTIKVEDGKGFYAETLDRSKLWSVQTPQGFHFALLLKAHKHARSTRFLGTDEASLVERLGSAVRIVEGDDRNIKITTQSDLEIARLWLK